MCIHGFGGRFQALSQEWQNISESFRDFVKVPATCTCNFFCIEMCAPSRKGDIHYLATIRYPYAVETNHNNHSEEGFLKRSPLRKRLISGCCVPICWHMRFANLHGAFTFHHVIWATVHCPFPQAIKRRTQHHITSLQASCWLQSAMILRTFAQRPFIQEGHATSLFPRFSLSEVALCASQAMHIQARRGRGRWKSQGNIL